ncbi:MAG: hypothetical protein E6767_01550 [Dysgonomonas sp.]|nr:hypothetical protein [Dysgonomonas sp.]
MRIYIVLIILFLFADIQAQTNNIDEVYTVAPFAIIVDEDGYTNIRDDEKQIIGKIYNNQVFAVPSYADDNNQKYKSICWQPDIPLGERSYLERPGLIHFSRVKYLKDLPLLKRKIEGGNVIFSDEKYNIQIRTGYLIKEDHVIESKYSDFIDTIDGYEAYGIDGILPDKLVEIKEIIYSINGKEYKIPQEYLTGYFSPTPENMYVAISDDNTFFICMSNGDAAGAYAVVWTIKNDLIVSVISYRDF